jgi:hypothetical protein
MLTMPSNKKNANTMEMDDYKNTQWLEKLATAFILAYLIFIYIKFIFF